MAKTEWLETMIQIEADAIGSDIELRLSDGNGDAMFRLDTHEATHLILKVCQAIQSIPGDPTAPLGIESPTLLIST